jgi:hypothetical protein
VNALLADHGDNRHPNIDVCHSLLSPLLQMHALVVASRASMGAACASAFSLLSPLDGSLIEGCSAPAFSAAVDSIAAAQVVAWRKLAVWRNLSSRFSARIHQNHGDSINLSIARKTAVSLLESFDAAIRRVPLHAVQLNSTPDNCGNILLTAESELVGAAVTSAATVVSCLRYFLLRKQQCIKTFQDEYESDSDEEFVDVFGFGDLQGDVRSDSVPPHGVDVFHKHLRDARDPTVVRPDDQVVFAALKVVCGMDFEMGMTASMLPPTLQGASIRLLVSEPDPSLPLPALPPLLPVSDIKKPAATFRFAPTSRRALVLVGHSAAQKGTDRSRAESRVDSALTGTHRSASVGDVVVSLAGGACSSSTTEPSKVPQPTSIAAPQEIPSTTSFKLDAATVQELELDEAARYALEQFH